MFKREIWTTALVMPAIVVPVTLALFAAIALFLDFFHDYALWIGLVMFIGISAGAYVLARRSEEEMSAREANAPDV